MTELATTPLTRATPQRRQRYAAGATLALMGALGFATSGPLSQSVLAAGMAPTELAQVRQTVSATVLLLLVALLKPSALRIKLAHLPMLALYGITSYLLLQTFFFIAISRIPIGIALLIQFTAPIWVALWVRFVRGTPLPRVIWFGAGLVLTGLVFVGEVWDGLSLDPIGVLAALGTALCLTCFYLMAERGLSTFDPLGLVAWGSGTAALLFAIVQPIWHLPLHLLTGPGGVPEFQWPVWALVLTIGVLSTAMPAVSEVAALRYIASPTASVLGTTEVVAGALFAWVLIGQALTTPQLFGGLVVLAGIALSQARPVTQPDNKIGTREIIRER